jgi:hypothetical protein
MSDIFACRDCHAVYSIVRLQKPPTAPSRCEVCGSQFPPMELGEWLAYQHAEPEWTVQTWLTGAPNIDAANTQGDESNGLDQAVEVQDQTAAGGNKVLTMLTGGVCKFAALIAHD